MPFAAWMPTVTLLQGGDGMRVYLLGAGGHARETLCIYRDVGRIDDIAGCLVDKGCNLSATVHDKPVLLLDELTRLPEDTHLLAAIGSPLRRKMIGRAVALVADIAFDTVIHPSVVCSDYVKIGVGVTVAAGCVLTTEVSIGDHVILNVGVLIHHDVSVGAYTTLSPRVTICGRVSVGEGCVLGTGCTVMPGVRIGDGAYVGAGSLVLSDVPPRCLAYGSPARVVKDNIQAEDISV
jgi:sugar O-acyltransferase (sialic acid O-acetyltransferase NeuD family)